MSLGQLLLMLLVAGVCGSIARSLVGISGGGCLASIALGFIGALVGTYLAQQLGLPELLYVQVGAEHFPILWSIIGAAIFSALLNLLAGRGRL